MKGMEGMNAVLIIPSIPFIPVKLFLICRPDRRYLPANIRPIIVPIEARDLEMYIDHLSRSQLRPLSRHDEDALFF